MINCLKLSFLYTKYLVKKRAFINCILLLLVIGFYLIPDQDATYVTFYINNISALPNKFWIGNLGAVFSNVIISFLLLFMILGEREKEILQNSCLLEDTSPLKKTFKLLYKILALYFVSLIFLIVLNISLIVKNFHEINFIYYVFPLIYFSLPYLFVLSVFSFSIEYFVSKKLLKYPLFLTVFFIVLFNDKQAFDIIGINELHNYLAHKTNTSAHFAIGYLPKSDKIESVSIENFLFPLFFYKKIMWILIASGTIFLLSKINISRQLSFTLKTPIISDDFFNKDKYEYKNIPISKNITFKNLFLKDVYLFSFSFNRFKLLIIATLWLLMFFISIETHYMLLSFIILFSIEINSQFLCKLFFYDLQYKEKQSPFNSSSIFFSKLLILMLFYVLILVPHIFSIDINSIIYILFVFVILATLQILISNYFKNNVAIDIIMITIFASYLTGNPIINIFPI
jgi:hypothetical protein